ncbi:MAG TPA: GtrA family protein [Beijerinckiaceae bacterium]|jgi:putative flippase GtrA
MQPASRARTHARSTQAAIVGRYLLFAVVATLANLGAQELVVRAAPIAPLSVSILVGTVVGFGLKYVLDKRYAFDDPYEAHGREVRKLLLYGAFSVVTTLVFWTFEVAFWLLWGTATAKYAGAVLGLAIGYVLKFLLDSRFVFTGQARAS